MNKTIGKVFKSTPEDCIVLSMEGTVTETQRPNSWGQTQTASSPWGKTKNVVPCSLEEVMSEQLAGELQQTENTALETASAQALGVDIEPEIQDLIGATSGDPDTDSDAVLARMLQIQYDEEHNKLLKAEEKHNNGTNKVTVSYSNYICPHPTYSDDDDDDENLDDEGYTEKSPWDNKSPSFNAQGYSGKGKNITTKHDAVICGRKNASKMMDFPPEFVSGDGEGMDMQLPNHVYNKLKRHSDSENKRNQRLHDKKEHSTAEHAMDPRTRLILYKLVNNGTLESVSGSISTGKESVVHHAIGGSIKDQTLPAEVAIKVFKTTLNEFKTREKYVHGDHRFSKDDYKKQNPRKIIKMWAMKEVANLNRMRKFNIPCPEVQLLRKHVLVMSFIGQDQRPAPKLKDARMSQADLEDAYDQVVSFLRKMYKECGLVHADLSEYNMLWWREKVWIIDVSQSVDITHPKAMEFLYRDCQNVASFFIKNGVHNVLSAEKLFNKVTKLDIKGQGSDFVAQVQRYDKEKREELLVTELSSKTYPFDYFFEKSQRERSDFDHLQISDSDSDDEEGDN